jgi:hypothetical protein
MTTENKKRLFEWFAAHEADTLAPDDYAEFQETLRQDAEARQLWFVHQDVGTGLRAHLASEPLPAAGSPVVPMRRMSCRPITAAAAGVVIGCFSASLVWAMAVPKATTERLFSLVNGGFESDPVEAGFPERIGVWSGDEAEVTTGTAREGAQRLRFVKPRSERNDPGGRAISCDIFQLVDLRPLRAASTAGGESLLELSASFLDARPDNTNPSVTFFCQLYLFRGDPAGLHRTWPTDIPEALSSGSAQVTTLGSRSPDWKTLRAKALVPADADFAVIQIAARPNLRPAPLEALFADDIQLTLKTSPPLPVSVVKR